MNPANPLPRVCVIVVTYNSASVVGRLLASLRADKPAGYEREVVVVDNASGDNTLEVVQTEFPTATVIANSANLGYGAANNLGAASPPGRRADFLAVLNPDTVVTPGWLNPLLDTLAADTSLASVQPLIADGADPQRINSNGNQLQYLGYGYVGGYGKKISPSIDPIHECAYTSGCACVFRAADFRAAGGYDERFFLYVEDQDLGWRLCLAGRHHAAVWTSVVQHHYDFDKNSAKFYYLERNRWVFLLAHYAWPTLLLLAPAALFTELASWAFFVFTGRLRWKWRAVVDLLRPSTWRWIRAKRFASQLTRRRSDRDLSHLLVAGIDFAGLRSPALRFLLNPLLSLYWKLVRFLL